MDNLIHASATIAEAEREIKLWFKPSDIPPMMRIYSTERSSGHYYFKDNRLFTDYEPGSICLFSPGDVAWTTDLEALKALQEGRPSQCSLQAVAAKYLINNSQE